LIDIREASMPADLAVVQRLFREYAAGLGVDLCFQGFDEELASLPGRYAPPAGGLWLAAADGRPVGCVALRPLTVELCEIKRMYVQPECRGAGVGRRLGERALAAAASAGYRRACLDTLASMAAAMALYRSLGFAETEPYYHNPLPDVVFFSRDLP
jgi:GNAT superfamily N-acetyltransferase